MRYKASFIALLLVGLIFGMTMSANAVVTTASVGTAVKPMIGQKDAVIGVYLLTNGAVEVTNITSIKLYEAVGATVSAAQISKISLYLSTNGTLEKNVDKLLASTTTLTGFDGPGDGVGVVGTNYIELTLPDALPIAKSGTPMIGAVAANILVVADLKQVNLGGLTVGAQIQGYYDGATSDGYTADIAGQAPLAIDIVATHLQFNTAAVKAIAGSTVEAILGADAVTLLSAVDDYGNLDVDVNGASYDLQLTAEKYEGTLAATSTLTATGGAGGAVLATDAVGGSAITPLLGVWVCDVGTTAAAANSLRTIKLALAGGVTAENVTLVASAGAANLQGSITLRVGAAHAAATGIQPSRGIEYYDVDHNGYLDHATFFFDGAMDLNGTIPGAFSVAGYTVSGITGTGTNFDAGGTGIRNAGLYGITVTLTENPGGVAGTGYDTGAKPQATYNNTIGALRDTFATLVPSIVAASAQEVDKARPVILGMRTDDADNDGMVDGIVATFTEPVVGLTANTALFAAGANIGAFATALQNSDQWGAASNIALNGTVSTLPSSSVTISVIETIPNTGSVPILLINGNTANAINDGAVSATGAPSANVVYAKANDYSATGQPKNVDDGVSPIITNVTTADGVGASAGKIDQLVVTFSEPMSTINAYSFPGVSGYSSIPGFGSSGAGAGVYTVTTGAVSTTDPRVITYTIAEAAASVWDTEARPTIYYNPLAVGANLKDANGFSLAQYGGVGGRTVLDNVLIDGAKPVIVSKVTGDNKTYANAGQATAATPNGKIDTIVLTFSEAITSADYAAATTDLLKAAAIDRIVAEYTITHVPAGVMVPETSVTGAIAAGNTVAVVPTLVPNGTLNTTDTNSVLTIQVEEATNAALNGTGLDRNDGDTGVKPTVAYGLGLAADQVKDMNGTLMGAGALGATTDGAAPFAMNIITGDMVGKVATAGEDVGNGDGYIDNFEFQMSETVTIANATTVNGFSINETAVGQAQNTFTLLGFDVDMDTGAYATTPDINVTGTTADTSDNAPTKFGGVADTGKAVLYTTNNKDQGTYDTGNIPTVSYTGTNAILDANNLPLASFTARATVDGAKPVIVQAVGRVGRDEILVRFSEPIQIAGGWAALVGTDGNGDGDTNGGVGEGDVAPAVPSTNYFNYQDRNNSTNILLDSAGAIAAGVITHYNYTDHTRILIKTDANLTVDDVEKDFIWIKATGIMDASTAANLAVFDLDGKGDVDNSKSIMITIDDKIKPYLSAASTMDVDNDGWIDHIKLTLKDDDMDVTKFTGWVDAITHNVAPAAPTAGADGYADNLFAATGWDIAGFTGEQWDFLSPNNGGTVYNPANKTLIYIKVDETNGVTTSAFTGIGDTDQAPVITSAGAPAPVDFKGNVYTAAPMTDMNILATANITAATDAVGPVIMDAKFASETELRVWMSEQVDVTKGGFAAGANKFSGAFDLWVGTDRNTSFETAVKDFGQTTSVANANYLKVDWTDDGSITTNNTAAIKMSVAGGAVVGLYDNLGLLANANKISSAEKAITVWITNTPGTKTVAVTAPAVAANVTVGNKADIAWDTTNQATGDRVDLWASKDGGNFVVIASDLPFDGKYSWTAELGVWTFQARLADGTSSASSVALTGVAAGGGVVKTIVAVDLAAALTTGTSYDVTWTATNYANSDQVQVYAFDATGWKAVGSAVAANGAKVVWVATTDVTKLKVQFVSDLTNSDETAAFVVTTSTAPVNPITNLKPVPVPSTKPQINNENVARVAVYGTAAAADVISIKFVDAAGTATTAVDATANAQGNFTAQLDASPLANGMITIKAGKSVAGVVANWFAFGSDYLKATLTIGAPADLVIADVPGDQGGFVDVTFTKSANDAGNASDYYAVDYYVLQGKKGDVWFTVATLPVDGNTDATYRSGNVWVGMNITLTTANFRLNAHSKYSGVGKSAADGPDAMSSPYVYADGAAIDNLVPGAFTQFAADGSAGAGVVVNWTAPADHGLFNAEWNLWGVDKYDVYRKVTTGSDYELVGSVTPGTITYTDNVANSSTVYDYLVKAVDGDQITETTAVKAMASKGADFDGSGVVGLGDLVLLGNKWNITSTNAAYMINYDLNKNGTIGLDDLVLLGNAWNTSVAKMASTVPTVNNPFELKATMSESNSMYLVNINVQDAAAYNGLAFTLNYDTNAFEFVQESVNGLVGISFANEQELGVIKVASYFQNEKFNGTITLGFKSKGLNSDMNLKMSNAEVAINGAVSAVSGAPAVTLKALPTVYGLSQNFPNPFNPSTTITYSVPKTSRVELCVYNMAGQKVRTLVNSTQAASFYKVVWNGKNDFGQSVASGIYFYKLVAGDYSKVVKMNLIK